VWVTYRALLAATRYLVDGRHQIVFVSIVAIFALASAFDYEREYPERYQGAFAASLGRTLRTDYDDYLAARKLQKRRSHRIVAARARLGESTGDLARLERANVLLFVVESYGVSLVKNERYTERMLRFYDGAEHRLEASGYYFASHVFDSPISGGFSWLAHGTMLSGVRIKNQGEYKYVFRRRPKTLVHYFNGAGYRTVTAEPATKRPYKGPHIYGFRSQYLYPQLHYQGPAFSWAPMPDQYVIDAVHRRAIDRRRTPLFVKFSLVSSHVPWNLQPPIIHNWDHIKSGEIYNKRHPLQYPTTWADLSKAHWPYQRSILYVLEVITTYMERYVDDNTLAIIVGDHQPTPKVTDAPDDFGVLLHVISRNPDFIEKFLDRGYVASLLADIDEPPIPLETFPGDFLEDFSTPKSENMN
jgi:hypothetical protein